MSAHEDDPETPDVPPLRLSVAAAHRRGEVLPRLQVARLAHEGHAMSPFTGCTTAAEIEAQLAALNRLWWLTRRTA